MFREETGEQKDWKKEYVQLENGFVPPTKMRPIVAAFLNSGDIKIMDDITKEIKMPKKQLFLVGGAVRDFLNNKTARDYNLVTNATPEQIALILHRNGFKVPQEKVGLLNKNKSLKIIFDHKVATEGWKKLWYVDEKDRAKDGTPYAITAEVSGDKFRIETFRTGPKTGNPPDKVDFVDNIQDDANGRDLTINAMYLELSKEDGPNSKMYDPSGKGYYDSKQKSVRMIGKAEDRLKEDHGRLLRAIRFHCRYGKGAQMDKDIVRAIGNIGEFDKIELKQVKDEFIECLTHPDIDPKCLLKIFQDTKLLGRLFPNVKLNLEVPSQFSEKKDKLLAVAWILQDNSTEEIKKILASDSWNDMEKTAILFLLKLKGFTPDKRPEMQKMRKITGLSKDQIKNWVDLFNYTDERGTIRSRRPQWAKTVRIFANFDKPLASLDDIPKAVGIHPQNLSRDELSQLLDDLERDKFKEKLPKDN